MKDGKTLFLHRLYSKAAAYYLKIIHELFELDEEKIWDQVKEKRRRTLSNEARTRYFEQLEIKKKIWAILVSLRDKKRRLKI